MDRDGKTERPAQDADGQAQVAGGTHGQGMVREKGPGRRSAQLAVIVVRSGKEPRLQGEPFGHGQDGVKAAPGLDRTGHRQAVIGLEQDAVAAMQPPSSSLRVRRCLLLPQRYVFPYFSFLC